MSRNMKFVCGRIMNLHTMRYEMLFSAAVTKYVEGADLGLWMTDKFKKIDVHTQARTRTHTHTHTHTHIYIYKTVKVKQSRYRPGVAQRVPGS
jgi:hypothetical protein